MNKKISTRRRAGRPRTSLEGKILAETSATEKQAEEIVAQTINSNTRSIMVFEAASLLRQIEQGTHHLAIESTPIFQKINQYARDNGPHGKWSRTRDFLEEFTKTHAPAWDPREDARQGEIESRNREKEDKRIAKEIAEDARLSKARTSKFYTPDVPDGYWLCALTWEYRKRRRYIRRTWPTLRELKFATANSERTLKKIIKRLQPKKGEIIRETLRHKFNTRGALPLRYGPRLIVGVLSEFVDRLPEFPIDDGERKRLRQTALLVKRTFAARWCARVEALNAF